MVLQQNPIKNQTKTRFRIIRGSAFDFSHMPHQPGVFRDNDPPMPQHILGYLSFDLVARLKLLDIQTA
jgi:hypothetical protein